LLGLPKRNFSAADCPTDVCSSDTGQPVDPGGLREVLEIAATYGKPLWITENGISNGDDSQRPSYIVSHLAVVQDAIATDGMDIRGYTYWSLVDLLEWSDGYDSHFGLYSFDPETLERTARPSVAVLHQITTGNGLSAALLASYGSNVL
jgi:beta-galactosidase